MKSKWQKNILSPKLVSDSRGTLQELSFYSIDVLVKRAYWITMSVGQPRGYHAHKKLLQILTVIKGQIDLELDDGVFKERITLRNGENILITQGVWRVITPVSPESVIVVFASDEFDENDYIRSYDEFVKWSSEVL